MLAITLGTEVSKGTAVSWNPEAEHETPNPHVLITGESGFGKTYLAQCLLWELSKRGMSSVVVDIGRGFARSELHPRLRAARLRHLDASKYGLNLNPLCIRQSDSNGPLNVAVRVSDTFARVYRIGIQQKAALRDAILLTFERAGITADPLTWRRSGPSMADLRRTLEDLLEANGSSGRVVQSLYAHISEFFLFDVFRPAGIAVDWKSISSSMGEIVIFELGGLEGRLPQLTAEFLSWDLFAFVLAQGPHRLHIYCLVDEAHQLRITDASPVERLAREGRKFGVGLVLASQMFKDFSEAVYSNLHTKIFFQTSDPNRRLSRLIAAKASNLGSAEAVNNLISQLPKTEALTLIGNVARRVKIAPLEARG